MNWKRVAAGIAAMTAAQRIVRAVRKTSVEGKIVVVMGGSRGFGLDIARALVERKAHVAIGARDAAELERAREELAQAGGTVFAHACDASDEAQVKVFLDAVLAHFSRIDVLVTNAANILVGPLENMTRADFDEALRETFATAMLPTLAVLPHMRERKSGHLVHVTSFGGRVAVPHLAPYSVAKFAATGFSEAVRSEVAKDGITVTTVTPFLMQTGSHVNVPFKGQFEKEYEWFTAGLVAASTSSMRAAKGVVDAIEHRDVDRSFSLVVRVATIAKALSPSLVASLLALQNRFLPFAVGTDPRSKVGKDVVAGSTSRVVQTLDALTRRASESHNEVTPS